MVPLRIGLESQSSGLHRRQQAKSRGNDRKAVRAWEELGARHFLAMHWGTFKLTDEPLDEPPQRLDAEWNRRQLPRERQLAEVPNPPPRSRDVRALSRTVTVTTIYTVVGQHRTVPRLA